ncbi:MAG: dTDP-4-dehydrorhamnose reductase [Crenarchaeota archaeon]|nr:dTDP-4-dehydrorhamnose reductase [Thermoproteota archaeon]
MRALVTGASSSPGYKTVLELASKGFQVLAIYNTHSVSFPQENVKALRLDLTRFEDVLKIFNEFRPEILIHMAALGDVDKCEIDRDAAWLLNVEVSRFLAKISQKYRVLMLYLSTDYVFDGERGMYKETDVPYPVNYYGLTKLIAEEIVRSMLDSYIIVRTSAIYGLGPGRPNFGKVLIEKLSRGEKVRALVDQYLSPTLNTMLAKAIVEIIERGLQNDVLHIAGERINRYDFAIKLAEKFGFDRSKIEPIYMKDIAWKARRPRDSSLDVSRARNMLSIEFYSIDKSLDMLRKEYYESAR